MGRNKKGTTAITHAFAEDISSLFISTIILYDKNNDNVRKTQLTRNMHCVNNQVCSIIGVKKNTEYNIGAAYP